MTAANLSIYADLHQAIRSASSQGKVNLAISGGSTLLPWFEYMSKNTLSSENLALHVYWIDERVVPYTDSRNNASVAITKWLSYESNVVIHRIPTTNQKETIAQIYESELPSCFDIIILGMGEDGHIASIFPDSEEHNSDVYLDYNKNDDTHRITLNYNRLLASDSIYLLVSNRKKQRVLGESKSLPVNKLTMHSNLEILYVGKD